MDTQKLLKILHDIVGDEEQNNIADLLSNLASQIAQNTTESYNQATETRKELDKAFTASVVNGYSPSYQHTLVSMGVERYFGAPAKLALDEIFSASPLDLSSKLSQLVDEYRGLIDKARQLISSLESMGIKSYSIDDYEIGLSIPDTINNLQNVTDHLFYWDRFLVICSEVAGEKDPSTKLYRVSNGSFEFFVVASIGVAKIVDTVLKHILDLYKEIQKIKKICAEIDNLNASSNEHKANALKALAEAEKAHRESYIQKASDEVLNQYYKGDPTRKDELHGQFMVALKVVLSDVQKGIQPEVSPPTAQRASQGKKTNASLSNQILKHNRALKELYSTPIELKKLPFKIEPTIQELEKIKPKRKVRKIRKALR